jgi:hypothetical protein
MLACGAYSDQEDSAVIYIRGDCHCDRPQVRHVVEGCERLSFERRRYDARWKLVASDTVEDNDLVVVPHHDERPEVVRTCGQVVEQDVGVDCGDTGCRVIGLAYGGEVSCEVIAVGVRITSSYTTYPGLMRLGEPTTEGRAKVVG